jgi:hypothetical protein
VIVAGLSASRNRRTQKRSGDHAGRIRAILASDVKRGAVVWRSARKWKTERHVDGAAERSNLDGRHPHVVIRRYHRVELAAHCAHENGVRRERASDFR